MNLNDIESQTFLIGIFACWLERNKISRNHSSKGRDEKGKNEKRKNSSPFLSQQQQQQQHALKENALKMSKNHHKINVSECSKPIALLSSCLTLSITFSCD
jgi:hypothetical protein